MLSFVAGLGTGLALIVAIGAQNAFVLRQGIRREHIVAVVLVCIASDLILINVGVAGLGAIVETWPAAIDAVRYLDAAFLIGYALVAARRAWRPEAMQVNEAGGGSSLRAAVATCMALTWLNPHVYLDTVILLGSVANGQTSRWCFAIGACCATVIWFVALAVGARALTPLFKRPNTWRLLDGIIAAVMLSLGAMLLSMSPSH